MRRLKDMSAILLHDELPTILAGDYNVIPEIKTYMIRKAGSVMLPLEKRHIFTGEAY